MVALEPAQHDSLVAVVSHVPHLTAATLMDLAADVGQEHAALLQLAAGGFRDMTRIAAGQPSIWPDICDDNAEAIVSHPRPAHRRPGRHAPAGGRARPRLPPRDPRTGRRGPAGLSETVAGPEELVEVRIPVPDRPGVIAEITVLAAELGINIVDLEIAHSVEAEPRRAGRGGGPAVGTHPGGHPDRTGLPGHEHPGGTEPVSRPRHRHDGDAGPGARPRSVTGGAPLTGTLAVPGDKSISHRALLLAALAEGTSTITGLSDGDDVARTRLRRRRPRGRGDRGRRER